MKTQISLNLDNDVYFLTEETRVAKQLSKIVNELLRNYFQSESFDIEELQTLLDEKEIKSAELHKLSSKITVIKQKQEEIKQKKLTELKSLGRSMKNVGLARKIFTED